MWWKPSVRRYRPIVVGLLVGVPHLGVADSVQDGGRLILATSGSGHATLELTSQTRVYSASIQADGAADGIYTIVLSGPVLWFYVQEERPSLFSPLLPAGHYDVYLVGAAGTSWVAILDFGGTDAFPPVEPWQAEGFRLPDTVPTSSVGAPIAIHRASVNLSQDGAIIVLEHNYAEAVGAYLSPSLHHVQGDVLTSDCRPWLGATVGTYFGFEAMAFSFFPSVAGPWNLGLEHAAGSGLESYHAAYGYSLALSPNDANLHAPNPFWSSIWTLAPPGTIPREAEVLAESAACTMAPVPVNSPL
jgi:hypothetical protein